MDFSSAKRGTQPAPAQNRRHRNPPQTQSRNAPIPPRQRHTDPTYYHPEDTSSQHNHDTYGYNADSYPDQSSQWERQPSAHLSEIESVEESQLGSQQQGDMGYEGYESDNRLIPAPRSHGDRQNYEGVEQYDEVVIVEPRHPSASRIRQAQAVEKSKNNREPLTLIGKTGPEPFKVPKVTRTRGHQHNDAESVRYETRDDQQRHPPPNNERREFVPFIKANYRPSKSKLSQTTKFDTPSEKGSRTHRGDRSSETSQRIRSRHQSGSDGMIDSPQVDYTPTAASRATRHSAGKVEQDISFDIDEEFDDSTLLFDGPSDDRLDNEFNEQGMSNTIPPTPPSDRTLALGSDLHVNTNKPKMTLSSGIDLGSDGLGDDMMEMFDDVVKDVVPTTKLQLKMPKTVDQVVKHVSTILAKKVAKDQGDIAIKSSENWDWSRLSVLSSEMNEGIKEMEDMIKGAGERRQGGIEGVKRKRVDMESQVTAQYEEFRKDFREACEKMQQPAILGKKFKFGPFP